MNEKGIDVATNKALIKVNTRFFWLAEVEQMLGDPAKPKTLYGWNPIKISFAELIK